MRMIVARQGECDFDDFSTRTGWFTEKGKEQIMLLANKLAVHVGRNIVVVLSNSKRGRTLRDLFQAVEPLRSALYIVDAGCRLDDSHSQGTMQELAETIRMIEPTDTILIVGHQTNAILLGSKICQRFDTVRCAKNLPELNPGEAYVFDADSEAFKTI